MSDEVDKQLHGTIHYNKIEVEGNFARNDYHFDNDERLKEEIQDIKEKIKRCPTNKTILNLLDNAISTNKKVLEANYQFLMHYLKYHLKTETLTMDLLESNQTVKNLHDLVERHGEFGNFLAKQIKHYNIIQAEQTDTKTDTPSTIDPTGKPWESNYKQVVSLCNDFDKHLPKLVNNGYITIKDNCPTFTWDKHKANMKDFAKYFSMIKNVGQGVMFWRHIVLLFRLAPSNNNDLISKKIATLTKYANDKKYTSNTLDILLEAIGLKKNP